MSDGLFASKLRCAIDVPRTGQILFHIGRGLVSIEDVIGRVVHQPCTERGSFNRHHTGRGSVHGETAFAVALRFVHRGIRGCIHDDVRPYTPHQHTQLIRIREIAVSPRRHLKLTSKSSTGLQSMTHLPIAAKEKYAHVYRCLKRDRRENQHDA